MILSFFIQKIIFEKLPLEVRQVVDFYYSHSLVHSGRFFAGCLLLFFDVSFLRSFWYVDEWDNLPICSILNLGLIQTVCFLRKSSENLENKFLLQIVFSIDEKAVLSQFAVIKVKIFSGNKSKFNRSH